MTEQEARDFVRREFADRVDFTALLPGTARVTVGPDEVLVRGPELVNGLVRTEKYTVDKLASILASRLPSPAATAVRVVSDLRAHEDSLPRGVVRLLDDMGVW